MGIEKDDALLFPVLCICGGTTIIGADTVKLYKLLPKVYQLALKHMRLQKSESLFVSSSFFNVVGAKNFGFRVCRINRTGAPLDPLGPKPDLVVKSLDDIVGAL